MLKQAILGAILEPGSRVERSIHRLHVHGAHVWSAVPGNRERLPAYRHTRQLACTVDHCSFGDPYMKPTHIWTTMKEWVPDGATGTGRCDECCGAGDLKNGRWNHIFKIAQGSWQAAGGKGRRARKNMMPQRLQKEIMDEAVREHKRKQQKRKR